MYCTDLHHILVSAVSLLISMTWGERKKINHLTSNATTSVKSCTSIHGSEDFQELLGVPANQCKPTVPIRFIKLPIASNNCNRGKKKVMHFRIRKESDL